MSSNDKLVLFVQGRGRGRALTRPNELGGDSSFSTVLQLYIPSRGRHASARLAVLVHVKDLHGIRDLASGSRLDFQLGHRCGSHGSAAEASAKPFADCLPGAPVYPKGSSYATRSSMPYDMVFGTYSSMTVRYLDHPAPFARAVKILLAACGGYVEGCEASSKPHLLAEWPHRTRHMACYRVPGPDMSPVGTGHNLDILLSSP